ncbi:hypothetical protein R3W88_016361 [Solanum pinnatisectum]|uniref:Small ribosomal subunit protein uS7 domain-containing protein n=1 Tax=Solanum pinnatisectum TaxID=50273 RepID=A0AAV9KXV7_9SOLN|nr:hypothetical protein R3W88_016361 [Solanum pinnatisectum]
MSRRGTAEKTAKSDPIYRNRLVNMLVNRIQTRKNHWLIKLSIELGVTHDITLKARRLGGSTNQVAIEIGSTQGKALDISWLLAEYRKRPGRNMAFKLSSELVDAAKGSGDAIRKKEETHRMAEANRAFAHFR